MTIDLLQLDGVCPQDARDEMERLVIVAEACVPPPGQCPVCGKQPLYKHGRRTYQYADTPMHGKPVMLDIERQRFRCKACGKVITPDIPSLDDKRIATRRLVQYVESCCLSRTFTAIAHETGMAVNTVKNIAMDYIARLDREYVRETPRIMGVDELRICGNDCVVITNLEMVTVFDILPKRAKDVITPYFKDLKNKEKVEWIVLDMWGPYKDVLGEQIPRARMVSDKLHVVERASTMLERLAYIERHSHQRAKAYDLAEAFQAIFELDDRAEAEAAFKDWAKLVTSEYDESLGGIVRMVNQYYDNIFGYFDLGVAKVFAKARHAIIQMGGRMGRGYGFEIVRGRCLYDRVPAQAGRVVLHSGRPRAITDSNEVWGSAKVIDYGRYMGEDYESE